MPLFWLRSVPLRAAPAPFSSQGATGLSALAPELAEARKGRGPERREVRGRTSSVSFHARRARRGLARCS